MPLRGEIVTGEPVEVPTPIGPMQVPGSFSARVSLVDGAEQPPRDGASVEPGQEAVVSVQPEGVIGVVPDAATARPVQQPWETRTPELGDFQNMWRAAQGDGALSRLVLRPRARKVIDQVNAYLEADGLEEDERGMRILSLVGSTGDGKTSIANAVLQRAQARGTRTMELDPLDLLSGTAHASQRAFRQELHEFLGEAEREARLEGHPARAVIVLNEGHAFASRTEGDPEWRQRAAALNNIVDQYAQRQDMQIVLVITSRFPLAPDVQRRAGAWTLEVSDPRPAERALALYNLLKRSVGKRSGTSRTLDDEVVEAVKHLGSLAPEKLAAVLSQLESESDRGEADEYDEEEETSHEHDWATKLFRLVRATRGFAFGDITELVTAAKKQARSEHARVSFDLLVQVASEMRPSIEDRHEEEAREAQEMGLRTRRTGAAA